jgi:hypothetical protein
MRIIPHATLAIALVVAPVAHAHAGGLDGSSASMQNQHEVAVEADYSFLRKPADVKHLAKIGKLVEVEGNADYELSKVSFPYARPEVLSFIERLASEYHAFRRGKLVVTSLTRPTSLQPANAHNLSVHPAGMAVDLRVPADATMRDWLEQRLLQLEDAGAIDVTREHSPPHYHVAVFGDEYRLVAAREDSVRAVAEARRKAVEDSVQAAADSAFARADDDGAPAPLLLGALTVVIAGVPLVRRNRRRRQR